MNPIRRSLLEELLANQETFVSGEELSTKLSVSRTAIWKHIEELRKEGYEIKAVRKQGYQLSAVPKSLSASTILPYLVTRFFGQALHVFDQVESTQIIAKKLASEGAVEGSLVICEQQTIGKGRLGRSWFSPSGTGLWLSIILRPNVPITNAPQLTLLTAVAVLRGIRKVLPELEIQIKWPNDLLINGKKIAGILTEMHADADQIKDVIIGIGLNVNQEQRDFLEELHSVATSLMVETGQKVERAKLLISILEEWEQLYLLWLEYGFSAVKPLWESYAISLGRKVTARTAQGSVKGIAKGISDEGVLLISDEEGNTHKIYSADIETN